MKILILGGFLGSGKTSVLLQLAHFMVDTSKTNKTGVAIIENEIGQIGIDDKVLKQIGYNVKELFSGCVCCSLAGDLIAGIQEISSKSDPEWMIIESTGVAFPSNIAEVIYNSLGISARIITIIDASRWKRIHVPLANLIEGQLDKADIILINKIDLVDEKNLKTIETDVQNINSDANLYRINGTKQIDIRVLQEIIYG